MMPPVGSSDSTMDSTQANRTGSNWSYRNVADYLACALVAAYILIRVLRLAGLRIPTSNLWNLVFVLTLVYLLFSRGFPWVRAHLPWRLRNRLIVAYLFIAVVPMVLLFAMAILSVYLLYWHFGAYLLYADIQNRVQQVSETAENVAEAYAVEIAANGTPIDDLSTQTPPHRAMFLAVARESLPGLKIAVGSGQELLERATDPRHAEFAGLVQNQDAVALCAVIAQRVEGERLLVSVTVPISAAFLSTLEPGLGPIQIEVLQASDHEVQRGFAYRTAGRTYARRVQIQAPDRAVPPKVHWYDYAVTGYAKLNAIDASAIGNPAADIPVIARFTTRSSRLTEWLFTLVGEYGGFAVTAFLVVGTVFLVIELGSLAAGIALTRIITNAVDDLYDATQHVRAGDLTHRVEIKHHDQLADLGESFNSMTASVAALIEEHSRRERLENELTIAREVQAQLFPKERPTVPGIEVDAICRPARIVSGDYYDFVPLGPTRMGIALADISGKGISAALIMASLQAALRSQALVGEETVDCPAQVVARLNQHLYRSTSEERYATLFYGVYDSLAHTFEYTNAGHPPPFYIAGQQTRRLDVGGTVLGLFSDCHYEQETIEVSPGSLLVMFSDGVTEPENSQGEEFGEKRLVDVARRNPDVSAHAVLEALVKSADQWAGTAEQTDDLTIIVARFRQA
jgi:sigma-B regulation protein RsbU (phosphoserine phosphatase)